MKTHGLLLIALFLFSGCASSTPDLPSGDEQQLDQPGNLSGPPPAAPPASDPFDPPDERTLPPIPGER